MGLFDLDHLHMEGNFNNAYKSIEEQYLLRDISTRPSSFGRPLTGATEQSETAPVVKVSSCNAARIKLLNNLFLRFLGVKYIPRRRIHFEESEMVVRSFFNGER